MEQGWTDQEIEDETRRRRQAQVSIEGARLQATEQARIARANTTCGHCDTPIEHYGGGAFPLCAVCDDKD